MFGFNFMSKKRQQFIFNFAELLKEIPKVKTSEECVEGYKKVADFLRTVGNKRKDLVYKNACGDLVSYLVDTKGHIERGYHKPQWNGWETKREYPNINDYVKLGINLNQF